MLSQPQVQYSCSQTTSLCFLNCLKTLLLFVLYATGQFGAGIQTEQGSGRHLHGLSFGRCQQLCGGE